MRCFLAARTTPTTRTHATSDVSYTTSPISLTWHHSLRRERLREVSRSCHFCQSSIASSTLLSNVGAWRRNGTEDFYRAIVSPTLSATFLSLLYVSLSSRCEGEKDSYSQLDIDLLKSLSRFYSQSWRFRHAYQLGLDRKQAAWAAKQYHGHCVVPSTILEEYDHAHDPRS